MSKIKPAKPLDVIRTLEKLGFQKIRQSGSHAIFHHPDGRWTTVPIHKGKDVAIGTLRKILKDAHLTYDEFKKMSGKHPVGVGLDSGINIGLGNWEIEILKKDGKMGFSSSLVPQNDNSKKANTSINGGETRSKTEAAEIEYRGRFI